MGKPIYLKVNKTIDKPLVKVWDTVALGFGNVADYNPEIASSNFDIDQTSGVGTKRHCNFPWNGYIKEKIFEWEDGKSFKIRFSESSVPMGFLESKFNFSMF